MTFEPIVGSNGRLYFNYNKGARIQMIDERGEQYVLKILDCQYVNGKEYYQVSRNGQPMLGRMSVNRLTFLLNHNQVATLDMGDPCELPLTYEEVKLYAGYMRRMHKLDIQRAEKQLEESGYNERQKQLNSLYAREAIASSRGNTSEANNYRKNIEEIKKIMSDILDDGDIDISVLNYNPCGRCNDTGFIGADQTNGICRCMRDKQAETKALCALWRK